MIRNLRVTNFKSLRDVSLDLGPRNILVGPNMSGKSSVISVFRFLRQMVAPPAVADGLPSAIDAVAPGGFTALAWRVSHPADLVPISLSVAFAAFDNRPAQSRF